MDYILLLQYTIQQGKFKGKIFIFFNFDLNYFTLNRFSISGKVNVVFSWGSLALFAVKYKRRTTSTDERDAFIV
jgi:hypothetical protein